MNLHDLAQAELIRSNADRRHPFRFFSLATQSDFPEIRTVVKRDFTADWSILFYTDERTPKVEQIKENAKVSALFYHPKKQLQIRIKGIAEPIAKTDAAFSTLLNQVKQSRSASDYLTKNAPGTPLLDESQIVYGDDFHFLPIWIRTVEIDILQLKKEGHERTRYTKKDNQWLPTTLTP